MSSNAAILGIRRSTAAKTGPTPTRLMSIGADILSLRAFMATNWRGKIGFMRMSKLDISVDLHGEELARKDRFHADE
jgi:hypothetical protein